VISSLAFACDAESRVSGILRAAPADLRAEVRSSRRRHVGQPVAFDAFDAAHGQEKLSQHILRVSGVELLATDGAASLS
jgi:hypothetical protein